MRKAAGLLLVLTLAAAACGDADDTAATTTTLAAAPTTAADTTTTTAADTTTTAEPAESPGDEQAYCDAALEVGAPDEPEIDWETASEEEVAAAEQAFVADYFVPQLETVRDEGSPEAARHAERLIALIEEAQEADGSLEEAIFLEGGEDRANLIAAAADDCGWTSTTVVMRDYEFEADDTYPAGTTFFDIANEGAEVHEMVLFRKNEDVEQSIEELLELPEEEAEQMVTFVTVGFAGPGEETATVADLEPGEYVMLCFVPVGTTSMEQAQQMMESDEEPTAPPHFTQGMVHTFLVS
jgi:hypothetical protein